MTNLWFTIYKNFVKYLPKGLIFNQAFNEGSNFNKLIKWIESTFVNLTIYYNDFFKSLYLKKDLTINNFKIDYNLPNEIFYNGNNEENLRDLITLKWLMKGNNKWHFQAIANLYDEDIIIKSYEEINPRPTDGNNNTIYIYFFNNIYVRNRLPGKLPYKFIFFDKKINKIKKIYDIIKPVNLNAVYLPEPYTIEKITTHFKLPGKLPYKVGKYTIEKKHYVGKKPERIKLRYFEDLQ